jgi:hypothetical protein
MVCDNASPVQCDIATATITITPAPEPEPERPTPTPTPEPEPTEELTEEPPTDGVTGSDSNFPGAE